MFIEQIKLASELKLPLVVHCRNGWDEIFDVISNIQIPNSKLTGVFHSWTGDLDAMQRALELGFYISFSGILTFKNALAIQEVAKKAPLDRIIIETDSPYLAPEPIRGQKNESGNVRIIAEFLSQLRNTSFDDISFQTSENAQILFNLL